MDVIGHCAKIKSLRESESLAARASPAMADETVTRFTASSRHRHRRR